MMPEVINQDAATTPTGRWGWIPESVVADRQLKANDVRCYAALALHADQTGICWPGQATIARLIGVARPTVNRCIKQLVETGHLLKVRVDVKSGWRRNGYRLIARRPPAKHRPVITR